MQLPTSAAAGGYPPPPPGGYPPPPQRAYGYPPPPQRRSTLPKEAYTPWFTRVLAFMIDWLPVWIAIGIGTGITFAEGGAECVESTYGYGGSCSTTPSDLGILVVLLALVLALAYFI